MRMLLTSRKVFRKYCGKGAAAQAARKLSSVSGALRLKLAEYSVG